MYFTDINDHSVKSAVEFGCDLWRTEVTRPEYLKPNFAAFPV